jgi:glycosyltransferase involved in cell wall biosynthesis
MDQIANITEDNGVPSDIGISAGLGEDVAAGDPILAPRRERRFVRQRREALNTRVSLVIPAMNEARNIGWVLGRLPSSIDEVILVDGNSVDDTVAVSRAIRPDIRVVGQERRGKGAALRAGFEAARGDIIVMIDADRSMDPAEIRRFLALIDEGYDLVKGSRFTSGGGTQDMEAVRRRGNAALRGLVNRLYGTRFTDLCYGYMAFRRSHLQVLALQADGFEIETEIIVRAVRNGLRVGEVPSFELPRAYGDSNLNTWRDGMRVLRVMLRHRFAGPRATAGALAPALAEAPAPLDEPLPADALGAVAVEVAPAILDLPG